MKRLSKFFLSVLLLTVASISWAACPEGTKQTYKGCEAADEEVAEGTGKTYDEEVAEGTGQTYKGCEETDSNLCSYDYTRKRRNHYSFRIEADMERHLSSIIKTLLVFVED